MKLIFYTHRVNEIKELKMLDLKQLVVVIVA